MFDTTDLEALGVAAACEAVVATQERLREQEWRELVLAAHWAVLHDGETVTDRARMVPGQPGGRARQRPGRERVQRAGGDGTPDIAEFACAELAVLMGSGILTAQALVRDAMDLAHRHPRLWAALAEGRGRVWQARRVARMTRAAGLSVAQAWFVDAAVVDYLEALPWAAFTRLVEARIIEADPAAAEQRRLAAAMERFVATGQSSEHGLKTLVARATAGEVIYFVAVCDRIAQLLAAAGDPDPVGARRSKALGILANPAAALALLAAHASDDPHPDDPHPDDPHPDDPHPDDPHPDDPHPDDPHGDDPHGDDPQPAEHWQPAEPDATSADSAGGTGPTGPGSTGLGSTGLGSTGLVPVPVVDPERLRPRGLLIVRISEQALRTRSGTAYCEGVGVITAAQAAEFLGHTRVTLTAVVDQRDQAPIDAYEIPDQMRLALRLARPGSVFPWTHTTGTTGTGTGTGSGSGSGSGSGRVDVDHSRAYLPIDQGGPPGQTRIDNLGPMTRLSHRIKTFGRGWHHYQPLPGTYLWRSPHGYWFRVDTDGTHTLGRHPDLTHYQNPPPQTPLDHALDRIAQRLESRPPRDDDAPRE